MLLLLAALMAQTCPPNAASAIGIVSTVAFYTNGAPVGPNHVTAGETLRVQMSVAYLPNDPITAAPTAAFRGGRMILTINGQARDVTPTNGIPVVGPTQCGGVSAVVSHPVLYTVFGERVTIQADYVDAETLLTPRGQLSASGAAQVLVKPESRLRLANNRLSFYGKPGRTYQIQGTMNFQSWATLGSVTPNDRGEAFFNISTGTNRAYYRFAYVP
jgi:hypothetical protein